ncbi:MAG: helicase [Methylocystis sp.]|nr:helicase [Methylocystis sp.]MCA3584341.1 helicase [Methylocystis sp.]MCA3589356.1 helicase [Methylocystis sp.]MCA3592638.1 helicase [Methylocystis sp.]
MPALSLPLQQRAQGVTAVLGPTNTGKTHLAIERMAAHSSGLIGLPLRLLAREVYNRLVEKVGVTSVALITGEEKIKPPHPRYWVATAEAMPRDLDVAFVAIDEIQLAADFDRGHVFTDHLLNRRGREETLLLGSATMKPLVERLLPGANIVTRPRLSKLSYAGEKKLTRLPPRSAIVAFSGEEVYAIAELIRRQRGGAAVVLGALSPRTRNAQVELFQSGDVDTIIATDAIGMGLNLDIAHVAFAGDSKFDGHYRRRLTTAEFGQIAGRAGRHLKDGTFGTSGRCAPFDPQLIDDLENHVFDPVKLIHWRNPEIDLRSAETLRQSLAVSPGEAGLARAPRAEDEIVFDLAAADSDIRAMIQSRDGVTRLWEICSLPDYRKVAPHAHAEMVGQIFGFVQEKQAIPEDWFQRQVNLCDRIDGDIDTLSARIAQIRTWTFCANRDWLAHPLHWQGVTRAIEDKLSDALHERLTARFVDRRTSVLMRRLRENAMLEAEVTATGEVTVEGQPVGRLQGFRFTPEAGATGAEAKALSAAALKALASEIEARAAKLAAAPDDSFALALDGAIRFLGEPVAKLQAGEKILQPRFVILADEQLTGSARESVDQRLTLWLRAHVQKLLGPLLTLEAGEGLEGISRGIAYQLAEHLGVLDRAIVQNEIKSLPQEARSALRKLGVRFGAYHITTPLLLKPAPRALAAQLWALKHGGAELKGLDDIAHLAASGRTSIPVDETVPKALYRAIGYRVCGPRAIRVDILERLADLIRPAIAFRPGHTPGEPPPGAFLGDGFTVTGSMTSLAGCAGEDFAAVLRGLGYRMEKRPPMKDVPIIPIVVAAAAPLAAPVGPDDAAAPAEAPAAEAGEDAAPPAAEPGPVAAENPMAEAADPASPEAEPLAEPMPVEAAAEAVESADPGASDVSGEAGPAAAESTDALPEAAEPELVEVWRPARHDRHPHGNRDAHRGPRRDRRPAVSAAPGEAAAPSGEPGQPRDRQRWQRRDRPEGEQARGAGGRPGHRRDAKAGDGRRGDERPKGDRPIGERPREGNRPPRDDRSGPRRDRDKPRHDQQRSQSYQDPKPRDKQPDPLSPFAQLAALKAQLEAKK